MKEKIMLSAEWLDAASVGALGASIGFYLGYDQWHPMVWASLLVSLFRIVRHFIGHVDGVS